jgi:6-phosphogluconolactonase (cycloisomerase 2 family)
MIPLLPLALAACPDPSSTGPGPMEALSLSKGGGPGAAGAVYILSNEASGNAVLLLPRSGNGQLGAPVSFATGGLGTGGGLGNQGALAESENGRWLYAVNPGSDEISAFEVGVGELLHLGNVSSGGDQPISLALRGDVLYVLNDGVNPNVTGFHIRKSGTLSPIAGSSRALSVAVPDAAQIGISPDGRHLVVTEKATNTIVSWDLLASDLLANRTLTTSASATPFGFAFDKRGTLIASEAIGGMPNASVVSSYRPGTAGWTVISPSVSGGQTAACWVAVTPNGRFAYATNTGSGSVTGFSIGHDGSLDLLNASGVTGMTGATPIDVAISHNGQ